MCSILIRIEGGTGVGVGTRWHQPSPSGVPPQKEFLACLLIGVGIKSQGRRDACDTLGVTFSMIVRYSRDAHRRDAGGTLGC